MAWNQPGNNGQDRDPWGSSNNQGGNSGEMATKVVASRGRRIWMISSAN